MDKHHHDRNGRRHPRPGERLPAAVGVKKWYTARPRKTWPMAASDQPWLSRRKKGNKAESRLVTIIQLW